MFKKLDTGLRSSSPETSSAPFTTNAPLRPFRGAESDNTRSRLRGTTAVQPPASAPNPFLGLRPMAKRPNIEAEPSSARPTLPRGKVGLVTQTPIEIDSDSDTSSILEVKAQPAQRVTDETTIKPKKSSQKSKSYVPNRHFN